MNDSEILSWVEKNVLTIGMTLDGNDGRISIKWLDDLGIVRTTTGNNLRVCVLMAANADKW